MKGFAFLLIPLMIIAAVAVVATVPDTTPALSSLDDNASVVSAADFPAGDALSPSVQGVTDPDESARYNVLSERNLVMTFDESGTRNVYGASGFDVRWPEPGSSSTEVGRRQTLVRFCPMS